MELSIAFLQLLPEGSLQENLNKGVAACREAKERGADIALFPEMWSTGYRFPHDMKALHELAISEESTFIRRFSETAAKLDMAIAITFLEEHAPKPKKYRLSQLKKESISQSWMSICFGSIENGKYGDATIAGRSCTVL